MEFRQLRYFVACAESQNLTEGAARLQLSQPALSRQIRDLENELGVVLFERLPRGVRLTAPGKTLLEEARRLIQQADIAKEKTIRSVQGQKGRLTIGFSGIASRHHIAVDSLRRFRLESPDTELQIVPMGFFDQLEAMRVGMIDAAFRFSEPDPGGEFNRLTLMRENILLVTQKQQFAGRHSKLSSTDLLGADFVWIKRDYFPYLSDRLMTACNDVGLYPKIAQEVGDDFTLLSLVSVGMGFGFVYASMRHWAPRLIDFHSVTDIKVTFDLDLMWPRGRSNPALERFIAMLRQI
jgi:DNA-binding transcriptional LysR family regulator